jgi:hypothetical protein
MLHFRMYIAFAGNVILLNKAIASIIPQINEFSTWEGKKIVIINNSMKPIEGLEHPEAVEIWQLPFELTHAQECNWMIRDCYDTDQPFCLSTHTDSELLPGAMKVIVDEYAIIKDTKWYARGIGSPVFVAYNPKFFVEENVWFDPFLLPFYYMDNHVGRVAMLRGWSDKCVMGEPTTQLLKHVSSHVLKEDPIFRKKNNIAYKSHGDIYAAIWGGRPGAETVTDPYASGTLPKKEV